MLQYVGDYTSPIRASQPQNVETEEQVGGGPRLRPRASNIAPRDSQGQIDTQMQSPEDLPPSDIDPTSSEDEEDQSGVGELREHTPSPAPRNPHATASVRNSFRRVATNKGEVDANQSGIYQQVRDTSDDGMAVKGMLQRYYIK